MDFDFNISLHINKEDLLKSKNFSKSGHTTL